MKLNKPLEKRMFVPNLEKIIENCNLYRAGIWMYKNLKFCKTTQNMLWGPGSVPCSFHGPGFWILP